MVVDAVDHKCKYYDCDYEGALEAAQRLIRFRPSVPMPYRWRAAALGQLGRINEAQEALQEAIEVSLTNFYGYVRVRHPYMRPLRAHARRIVKSRGRAGVIWEL